jgi:PAS domain S-box-containing protein
MNIIPKVGTSSNEEEQPNYLCAAGEKNTEFLGASCSTEDTKFFARNDVVFQTTFEHAATGMALVATDGTWMNLNRALCEILGYAEVELIGNAAEAIQFGSGERAVTEQIEQIRNGSKASFQMECRCRQKSGHPIWVLLSVSLVRSRSGTPLFFVWQMQNIDKAKQLEYELKARNEELESALREVKQLEEIVPICMYCKNIRDDSNYWHNVEAFVAQRSGARFSHCVCPGCMERFKKEMLPAELVNVGKTEFK